MQAQWRRQQYLGLCRSALWPQVRAALRAAARDAARAAAAAPAGRSGRSGAPALLRSCLAAHGGALLRLARAAAAMRSWARSWSRRAGIVLASLRASRRLAP